MRAAAALTIARAAIIAISLSAWRPAGGPFARELTTSMETAARDGRYRATTVSGNERTEYEGPRDRGSLEKKRARGLSVRFASPALARTWSSVGALKGIVARSKASRTVAPPGKRESTCTDARPGSTCSAHPETPGGTGPRFGPTGRPPWPRDPARP